ncbi:MAG: inositol monophosphatase family protein [Pseudomonadota bacterium]
MQGSANLNVMIKAVRKAGRSLLKDFGEVENLQVSAKSPEDFARRADIRAAEIIQEDLTEARANYGLLSRGTPEVEGKDPTRRWIINPLDGTANYLHGMPHWAISVALEHKGEVATAVIYDPTKDELFWAEKGAGAWLEGRSRLRVSGRSELIDAVFSMGIPGANQPYLPAVLKDLGRLMPVCAGVRQWGVTSLEMAYVAAGRYDGHVDRARALWDIAAGSLIVREAGGIVDAIRPDTQTLFEDGHVICGSGAIFDKFARTIRTTD